MAGMATSTWLYTVEFVAIESGAGVSKKFTRVEAVAALRQLAVERTGLHK